MATVKETFDNMASKFQPAKAAGVNATIQYDITSAKPASVEDLVRILILSNRCASEADTSEEASRSRVTQDLRTQLDIGGSRGVAPHGTSGD